MLVNRVFAWALGAKLVCGSMFFYYRDARAYRLHAQSFLNPLHKDTTHGRLEERVHLSSVRMQCHLVAYSDSRIKDTTACKKAQQSNAVGRHLVYNTQRVSGTHQSTESSADFNHGLRCEYAIGGNFLPRGGWENSM